MFFDVVGKLFGGDAERLHLGGNAGHRGFEEQAAPLGCHALAGVGRQKETHAALGRYEPEIFSYRSLCDCLG